MLLRCNRNICQDFCCQSPVDFTGGATTGQISSTSADQRHAACPQSERKTEIGERQADCWGHKPARIGDPAPFGAPACRPGSARTAPNATRRSMPRFQREHQRQRPAGTGERGERGAGIVKAAAGPHRRSVSFRKRYASRPP